MSRKTCLLLGLAVVVVVAVYAAIVPLLARPEPFAGEWKVDSVSVMDPATTETYVLASPCRVIRDGRVTHSRPNQTPVERIIRVDLTIEGEPVTIFTRLRE